MSKQTTVDRLVEIPGLFGAMFLHPDYVHGIRDNGPEIGGCAIDIDDYSVRSTLSATEVRGLLCPKSKRGLHFTKIKD